ncbi:MAG: response regulator transcription factor [Acidobacteriota bacterium]
MENRARVVVIANHRVLSAGLISMLAGAYECLGRVDADEQAAAALGRLRPDLAILVPRRSGGGLDAVDLAADLERQRVATRLVVLRVPAISGWLERASSAGVAGLLDERSDPQELAAAIEEVLRGGFYTSPAVSAPRTPAEAADGPAAPALGEDLTARQSEIACLVASGLRNREIAERLGISSPTVRSHLVTIFDKLGITNRVELALLVVGAHPGRPGRPVG